MAQANTGYVRDTVADVWNEVVYGGDAGAFINALVALLPATGGEIIIGPSTAGYEFTGALGSISKPCLIMCAPGANFQALAAGVGGCLRFTSGGAGSKWIGGQFSELSAVALNQARILIDVQDGAHDVHLKDIRFSIVNTVPTGQSCAMVQVAGSSGSSHLSGFRMDGCSFRCNSQREATSYTAGGLVLGWTCVRVQYAMHAKITNSTWWGGSVPGSTPNGIGNVRCVLALMDSEFCSFTGNSGRGLQGLSLEQVSGTDIIDAGACGLVEVTNSDQEGHHSKFEGNNFEVCTAHSFYRQVGANYGSVMNNHFGRMSMTDSVVRLEERASGQQGDATAIIGNTFHNVSGPSQIRNCGYAIRVTGQRNVLIDSTQFSLCNKQNAFERVPIRVDDGCRDIVIGSTQMGFNVTESNIFPPFTYIIWEGSDAYANTKLLFPTNFSKTPFVVT